jgi:hypothetical protein
MRVVPMHASSRVDCPRNAMVDMQVSRSIATMLRCGPRAVCVASVVVLTGCHGLVRVSYDKPALSTSTRSAEIQLVSGIIGGQAVPLFLGYIIIPIPTTASSPISFNFDDQRAFISSLVGELNRLKIVNAYAAADGKPQTPDILVRMTFLRTEERIVGGIYLLDVEMLITSGTRHATERYAIDSSEGQSALQLFFTRPSQAKEIAATRLLAAVIPDIEKFLSLH